MNFFVYLFFTFKNEKIKVNIAFFKAIFCLKNEFLTWNVACKKKKKTFAFFIYSFMYF